jgi:hypothetical protein
MSSFMFYDKRSRDSDSMTRNENQLIDDVGRINLFDAVLILTNVKVEMDGCGRRSRKLDDRQTDIRTRCTSLIDNSPTREPCRVKDGLQLCFTGSYICHIKRERWS